MAHDSDIRVSHFSLLVVFLYSPVSGSDGFSVVEIVIKSSYTICLVLVFVHGPGLIKFSFIGGNSNSNIFTNFLISTNKLRVTVAYRLSPCFPPKKKSRPRD